MNPKKNWQANLENFRSIFFLLGIILSLSVVTEIIQWQTEIKYQQAPPEPKAVSYAGFKIPITVPEKPEKPEPKKELEPEPMSKPDPNRFKQVDNNSKLEPQQQTIDLKNLGLDSVGSDPSYERPEPIMAVMVENMARPQVCEELRDKDEQMACFNRWIAQYLASEIEYPAHLRNLGIEEKLYVQFVINEFGDVEELKVLRGEEREFIDEAKRVLGGMPTMVPAKQLGTPVPVKVIVPVNFKLF